MKRASVPLLRRISMNIAVLPMALIFAEVFTRILLPQNVDSQLNINQPDEVVGIAFKPLARGFEKGREYNALYAINSMGLRDREYGKKRAGTFRILLLGDSFAVSHGLPIETSLSRQLEQAIQHCIDHDGLGVAVEVVNAARGGYSPYNYWKAYARWAPALKPDMVVVAMSPDDYDSTNAYLKYVIQDGNVTGTYKENETPRQEKADPVFRMRKWFSWNSQLYVLLRNFFYYNDLLGKVSLWAEAGDSKNSQILQYITPQPASIAVAWGQSLDFIGKLKADVDRDGLNLVIISLPAKLEIEPSPDQQSLATKKYTAQQLDTTLPIQEIARFCKAAHIPLLDPRDEIRRRHAETPCYFVYDGHMIAEGIRTAAESVARKWREERLPPWSYFTKKTPDSHKCPERSEHASSSAGFRQIP